MSSSAVGGPSEIDVSAKMRHIGRGDLEFLNPQQSRKSENRTAIVAVAGGVGGPWVNPNTHRRRSVKLDVFGRYAARGELLL